MTSSATTLRETLAARVACPVRDGGTGDAVQGVIPRVVAEPETEEEVAAVLALADAEGLRVLVRGAGTQLGMGGVPTGGDILLSMARLTGIVAHAPHDLTVTLRAGTPLRAVQAHLATARQWLALDPALPEGATIGGIVATNVSGARRLRYGGVRDQLIGMRVVLPDGTIARGGGNVVKNVAGYDLPKLYTGALGTLGVIVEATFRLYPVAPVSRTVVLRRDDPAALCDLARAIAASTLVPSAMDVAPEPDDTVTTVLAVRFETRGEAGAAEQGDALYALAQDADVPTLTLAGDDEAALWSALDVSLAARPGAEASALLKASVPPTALGGWLTALTSAAKDAGVVPRWRVHAGHGIARARIAGEVAALAEVARRTRAAAEEARGSLVLEDATPDLARAFDVWGDIPALTVMRRIKAQFDPRGTLNPGRFVGGL